MPTILLAASIAHAGQTVNVAWDASPDPSVVGYWVYYGPAPGTYTNRTDVGTALKYATPPLSDGTYYFTATARNSNGIESDYANIISTNISTIIAPPPPATNQPTIVSQPSSQTVSATSNFSLSVSVTSVTNVTYQWSKDGSPIANATDSTYSVANALRANAGTYTVAVTGNGTVTSSPAIVTVIDPVFYLQPLSAAVVVGQSRMFTAAANGTQPLHYQWYVVKSGAATALANQTNTSLTLTSIRKNDAGTYYCVADNGSTAQSSSAVLSVYTKQSQLPASSTLAANSTTSTTSAMSGTYNGLFADTTVSTDSSGSLANLVVSTDGTYSGKLTVGGSRYSLSGALDASGASTATITRAKGNLVIALKFDTTTRNVSGTVSCDAQGWSSPLNLQTVAYSAANPTQAAGATVNLVDGNNMIAGWTRVTNTVTGVVQTSGALADSTKFSASSALSSTGEWPLHVDLYNRTGLLQGWLKMSNGVPVGTLTWIKPGAFTNTLNAVPQQAVPPPVP